MAESHDFGELLEQLSGQRVSSFDVIEKEAAKTLTRHAPGVAGLEFVSRQISDLTILAGGRVFAGGGAIEPLFDKNMFLSVRKNPYKGILDKAIKKSVDAHLQALTSTGLSRETAAILHSLVETMVEGRVLQRQIEHGRFAEQVHTKSIAPVDSSKDPAELLSAVALGKRLSVSDETVRTREAEGKLFSILRPARKRGREYPAFQTWENITGAPLERVLQALGGAGSATFGFFVSPNDLLGGLTPVEALSGKLTLARNLDGGEELLKRESKERLQAVVAAAEAFNS